MGADLYIPSIYNRFDEQWSPRFHAAVAKRDAVFSRGMVIEDSPEQQEVTRIFDEKYELPVEEVGYFRDSYNLNNVFNYLGHSWWALHDAQANCFASRPIINKNGFISPTNAAKIAEACSVEGPDVRTYLANYMRSTKVGDNPEYILDEQVMTWQTFYMTQQMRLVEFFRLAAKLNEPIRAST